MTDQAGGPRKTPLELREEWVAHQLQRYRIATRLLLAAAAAIFLYLLLMVGKVVETPSWQFVVLVAFGTGCVALPLLNKFSLSKDGGSIEPANPIDFINAMEERAQETRVEVFEQTRQQLSALSLQIEEIRDLVLKTASDKSAAVVLEETKSRRQGVTLHDVRRLLPAVTNKKDPQKGRFGGTDRNARRMITATVSPSPFGKNWQNILFVLKSTDGSAITGDYAYFFMHDTFDPEVYRVKVRPGAKEVKLETSAVGAFTAGVAADEGETLLEIDLASDQVNAPDWWKSR